MGFTLNNAVDTLLKREFDVHRAAGTAHPLMLEHGLRARPFQHPQIDTWRQNFVGVQHLHVGTNFLLCGAIDDLWIGDDGLLHVVDYKATSSNNPITLDDAWKISYKRQMEFYQWLLRRCGFTVSPLGYFVYVNGINKADCFGGMLRFETLLLRYEGDDRWVEETIFNAHTCLNADNPPPPAENCEWCIYRRDAGTMEG